MCFNMLSLEMLDVVDSPEPANIAMEALRRLKVRDRGTDGPMTAFLRELNAKTLHELQHGEECVRY